MDHSEYLSCIENMNGWIENATKILSECQPTGDIIEIEHKMKTIKVSHKLRYEFE